MSPITCSVSLDEQVLRLGTTVCCLTPWICTYGLHNGGQRRCCISDYTAKMAARKPTSKRVHTRHSLTTCDVPIVYLMLNELITWYSCRQWKTQTKLITPGLQQQESLVYACDHMSEWMNGSHEWMVLLLGWTANKNQYICRASCTSLCLYHSFPQQVQPIN